MKTRLLFKVGGALTAAMLVLPLMGSAAWDVEQPEPASYRAGATLFVTSRADSGAGSLRQALLSAFPGDTIAFDPEVFPPASPMTITLLSALPDIGLGNLTIDASNAGVVLDGRYTAGASGLRITSNDNVVKGLQIVRFPGNGVEVANGARNTIGGDWTVGSAPHGEGNVITLNSSDGVNINGAGAMSNTVSGNLIGLDVDGTLDIRVRGMAISPNYANDQTLFIGTSYYGVWKTTDGGASWARVSNGLTISDVRALVVSPAYVTDTTAFAGTAYGGIFKTTDGGASWTRVDGGVTSRDIQALAVSPAYASDRHVFAATQGEGVLASTNGGNTWVARNSGMTDGWLNALAISPNYGADRTLFAAAWGQVFKSINQGYSWSTSGVITNANLTALAVSPNYASDPIVFTASDWESGLFNSSDGGSAWSPIGGNPGWNQLWALAISPNYASDQTLFAGDWWSGAFKSSDGGNNWSRIWSDFSPQVVLAVSPAYSQDQTLFVGTQFNGIFKSANGGNTWTEANAGLTERGNQVYGVNVGNGAQGNLIGGDTAGKRNVISNNANNGVFVYDAGTMYNTIAGNYIGTDASGMLPLPNSGDGVRIVVASYNVVGGDTLAERNIISGHRLHSAQVDITGTGADYNIISGNYIGTDVSGSQVLQDYGYGVYIESGAQYNVVGGTLPGERNLISGVGGVILGGVMSNTVVGNYIGTDATGTAALGGGGVGIGGAQYNKVGGPSSNERNIISGNSGPGVSIGGNNTAYNAISGNYIGVNVSGTAAIGNIGPGIQIHDGAHDNLIGGSTPGEGNLISGNNWPGLYVTGGAMSNTITGNLIGTDATGTASLGNNGQGININEGARYNRIGGALPDERNLIAYNQSNGIQLYGTNTLNNTITRNSIHSNAGPGIDNISGGNAELAPPTLTNVTTNTVLGIAPMAFITVEVYSDDADEGRLYEGTTVAGSGGTFTFTQTRGLQGPYLTATATDAAGNTSEFSAPVAKPGPPAPPNAAFTAFPLSGSAPLTVTFTDQSIGSITAWSWSFGDGGTSTAHNPSHTYIAAGAYTVSLTVSGPYGSDAETKAAFITVNPPAPPNAAFTAAPLSGRAPLTVTFTDQSTGNITAWSWGFGDGGTSTAQNPSHTYTTAGVYTVSLTVSGPYGSDIETEAAFISVTPAAAAGDAYEPDDTCTQAHPIPPDGTVQDHTIHQQADQDWVIFSAVSGTTYLIQVQPIASSPADMVLELYDQCGGLPQASQDYAFSPNVQISLKAPASGPLYLKLFNHSPLTYGPNVAYQLSIRALASTPTPGAVVIVAGRLKENDALQPNIHHATNTFYQLFLARSYTADRVYYLATNLNLPGVDASATAAHLQSAITSWAKDLVDADRPFTLYIMDHGAHDRLYLDKPQGEWITPQQLDNWLTQLETDRPGLKLNVIIDACYSGSFIDMAQTISKPGRVVATSTGAWNVAWASERGALFSDHFSAALGQGQSLYSAFQAAQWAVQLAHPDQTPWLDDDGDGTPNEAGEGQEAQQRGFAYAGTLADEEWPPYIVHASAAVAFGQTHGVIQAKVLDDVAVHRVWAVIYPPDYQPPTASEEMVRETLPTIVLQDQGNGEYAAVYTGFDQIGVYRVVVYAEDDSLLEAQPMAVEVRTGWDVFLPIVLKE
jgi:PKD repeat protein/photosystem II stability/assembly factor-like uncharacterized protein